MPYQVEAGSLLVVVATDREAIEMFDRLVGDGGQKAIVRDMRGVELDVNRLRALVEGRNDGRVRTP
jgi:hypothetical protein